MSWSKSFVWYLSRMLFKSFILFLSFSFVFVFGPSPIALQSPSHSPIPCMPTCKTACTSFPLSLLAWLPNHPLHYHIATLHCHSHLPSQCSHLHDQSRSSFSPLAMSYLLPASCMQAGGLLSLLPLNKRIVIHETIFFGQQKGAKALLNSPGSTRAPFAFPILPLPTYPLPDPRKLTMRPQPRCPQTIESTPTIWPPTWSIAQPRMRTPSTETEPKFKRHQTQKLWTSIDEF